LTGFISVVKDDINFRPELSIGFAEEGKLEKNMLY